MTTTKELELYRSNPNGNADDCNTMTEYSIHFDKYHKDYYLHINPCNITDWGGVQMVIDFVSRDVTMFPVKRRNAKVQKTCEDWLERHVDHINETYLANGMDGVREYVKLNWLAV